MDIKTHKNIEEQLEMFEFPKTEFSTLWESLEHIRLSHDKVRKRLFAEIGDLKKRLNEKEYESERLRFFDGEKPKIKWSA